MPVSEYTAVYRLYDSAGELLYVGVAGKPQARFKHHARKRRWWPEAARRDIQWHPDRETALQVEAAAIRSEQPRYNAVVPHPDGSLRGSKMRTTPEIARVPGPVGYRNLKMEDELWKRFEEAVKRADPDANRSMILRRLARWFVGDIDEMPRRPQRAHP